MKIGVIGSGSVGSFYGARLARCGHDVHFLMRRDLEAVRANGLTVQSVEGDFHLDAQAYGNAADIGEVDLVLCALKSTSMDVARELVQPCFGKDTILLALMNGLGIEEQFAQWFDAKRIVGGLAFVCINRGQPGIVRHEGYGRLTFGDLHDGEGNAERIAALFGEAGFEASVPPSLKQARWEKLLWNVPFNTLCITAGGVTTKEIMEDAGLRAMAETLIVETATAGNADGCAIDVDAMLKMMMDNTATMGSYKPSMRIDYDHKLPLEVDAILGEPVRRARRLNVPVPFMQMQYRLTKFLDRLNRGEVKAK